MRPRFALGVLLALGACNAPDYTPVRDWATAASLAADYPPAAVSRVWLPQPPAEPVAGQPGTDQGLSPRPVADDGIAAMQQALSTYLAAIGILAADGVLPYRQDPFLAVAPRAAATDAAGGRAVTALGELLRKSTITNAQAPDLRDTLGKADPSVRALVTSLAAAVARQGDASARADVAADYAALARATRDPAARAAVQGWAARRDQEFAIQAEARAQYGRIINGIGAGHAAMTAQAASITQEEVVQRIRLAENALRRATAALPRPMAPLPAPGT